MMPDGIVTALIAALSALGGAALAHWGALRVQAQRLDREAERDRAALRRQQRAECLGWVLEAATRMEALLLKDPESFSVSADKTASVAARQAYAATLLYLAAARPSASTFYQSTVRLQLALEKPSEGAVAGIGELTAPWRADCEALETILSEMGDG